MIIEAVRQIEDAEDAAAHWARLRRFHNVTLVRDLILALHSSKDKEKAKVQAENIRFSLMQAREYADAATTASLATRPNLAYYSAMSLAIAEVLMKQADVLSIAQMREHHSHHGLEFKIDSLPKAESSLKVVASALRAAPVFKSKGDAYGTFELWHRSARELPIVGERRIDGQGGYQVSPGTTYGAADERLKSLSKKGISLLSCFERIFQLREVLADNAIWQPIVRATSKMRLRTDGYSIVTLDIQPGPVTEALLDEIRVRPRDFESVDYSPHSESNLSLGGKLTITVREGHEVILPLPHCCCLSADQALIWPGAGHLNEFGYFYVSLHILGNYCRYYPDRWIRDVERATPIALAADRLLAAAQHRMPLLALSELSRSYYVASV